MRHFLGSQHSLNTVWPEFIPLLSVGVTQPQAHLLLLSVHGSRFLQWEHFNWPTFEVFVAIRVTESDTLWDANLKWRNNWPFPFNAVNCFNIIWVKHMNCNCFCYYSGWHKKCRKICLSAIIAQFDYLLFSLQYFPLQEVHILDTCPIKPGDIRSCLFCQIWSTRGKYKLQSDEKCKYAISLLMKLCIYFHLYIKLLPMIGQDGGPGIAEKCLTAALMVLDTAWVIAKPL